MFEREKKEGTRERSKYVDVEGYKEERREGRIEGRRKMEKKESGKAGSRDG